MAVCRCNLQLHVDPRPLAGHLHSRACPSLRSLNKQACTTPHRAGQCCSWHINSLDFVLPLRPIPKRCTERPRFPQCCGRHISIQKVVKESLEHAKQLSEHSTFRCAQGMHGPGLAIATRYRCRHKLPRTPHDAFLIRRSPEIGSHPPQSALASPPWAGGRTPGRPAGWRPAAAPPAAGCSRRAPGHRSPHAGSAPARKRNGSSSGVKPGTFGMHACCRDGCKHRACEGSSMQGSAP